MDSEPAAEACVSHETGEPSTKPKRQRKHKDPDHWRKAKLPKNTPLTFEFLAGLLYSGPTESWQLQIDHTNEIIAFSRLSTDIEPSLLDCVRFLHETDETQAEDNHVETVQGDDQGGAPGRTLIAQYYSSVPSPTLTDEVPSTSAGLTDGESLRLTAKSVIHTMDDVVGFLKEIGMLDDETMRSVVEKAAKRKRSAKKRRNDEDAAAKPAKRRATTSSNPPSAPKRKRGRPPNGENFPTRQQIPRGSSAENLVAADPPPAPEKKSRKKAVKYYEVERIIGAALSLGKETFLIKWVGFPFEECTWESLESVESAEEAKAEFFKSFGQPSSFKTVVLSPEGERFEKWKREGVMGKNVRLN
ncbi:uncharacterized protein LOC129581923 [Paramacrobiotus metropolitanus]|uniref:uncharacterized protein LOC129581923 n=1 Tax=Paramacrobiotus metropolitanus TaxID=2943436 RepID=UPI002446136D|nr:uncharacterized protein LOC129581923 [Paramacrobiotus metropolitanus]